MKKEMGMQKKQEPKKEIVSQKCTTPEAKPNPWHDSDKGALAVVIGQIFDVQKLYGKNPGQLQSMVELFAWVLAPYPVEKVIWAIGEYLKQKSDMPTPADICQIIDPKPQPWRPDKGYYISLKQLFREQGTFALSTDEIEYIAAYEDYMLKERSGVS